MRFNGSDIEVDWNRMESMEGFRNETGDCHLDPNST